MAEDDLVNLRTITEFDKALFQIEKNIINNTIKKGIYFKDSFLFKVKKNIIEIKRNAMATKYCRDPEKKAYTNVADITATDNNLCVL